MPTGFERPLGVALGLWLSLSISTRASALDAQGLTLETGSPDALCPDLRQTREAVNRRLGSLEVADRRGWRARYTIGHAPEGSPRHFVRLELFTPEGVLELSRDLPMRGESCSTMAEVIALVLDRHFRSLSLEEHTAASGVPPAEAGRDPQPVALPQPQPQPNTVPEPKPARAQTPSSPPVNAPAARDAGPSEMPARLQRNLFVFGEFTESTVGSRQALGARALAGIGRSLQLGSVLAFDLGHETQALPRGGSVSASSAQMRGFLAWGHRFGTALHAYAGPGFGLRLQRGEARDLPRSSDLLRAVWTGDLEAGLVILVNRRFLVQPTFALQVPLRPLSGKFYVDEQEVLRPAAVQPWVGLGAGYAFYP